MFFRVFISIQLLIKTILCLWEVLIWMSCKVIHFKCGVAKLVKLFYKILCNYFYKSTRKLLYFWLASKNTNKNCSFSFEKNIRPIKIVSNSIHFHKWLEIRKKDSTAEKHECLHGGQVIAILISFSLRHVY